MYNELSRKMADVAETVGADLQRVARAEPASTLDELKAIFGAIDAPAAQSIRTRLEPLCPEASFCEEFDMTLPARGAAWVVDAIDGAVQFMQGLPHWCVSITLVRARRPVAAVLHSPPLAQTYRAATGAGAFLDDHPITPSRKHLLEAALVATSQPPFAANQPGTADRAGRSLSAVLPQVAAIRNFGPTSWQVADTAAGRIDAFWQCGRDDTNLLGAALIAAESGTMVTDLVGRPWAPGAPDFLAAPAALHRKMMDVIAAG